MIKDKLYQINWLVPTLVMVLGLVGVVMVYASTDGVWNDGASQHLVRLCLGFLLMLGIALIDIRVWMALAYPTYLGALALLLGVEFFGVSVNGSQRWLDIGITRIQPSEIMKLAVVMALARFYHDLPDWHVSRLVGVLGAVVIIALPVALVMRQPDLGTSLLIVAPGVILIFLSGVRWRIISIGAAAAAIILPIFMAYGLKPYQRSRVLTFLNPERDPTGASYHIIQSKIALGSGGVNGKGFMKGTQAHLNYVPENSTDFIFTVIGEEFGLVGGIGLLILYSLILGLCLGMAVRTKPVFSRLLIMGIMSTFALYIFINLSMVMGMAPVVGVPLPLVSYGGTVMLAVMAGFGLILSAHIHRDDRLPRGASLLI